MVVRNVKNEGNPFEDWWVDPMLSQKKGGNLLNGNLGMKVGGYSTMKVFDSFIFFNELDLLDASGYLE